MEVFNVILYPDWHGQDIDNWLTIAMRKIFVQSLWDKL